MYVPAEWTVGWREEVVKGPSHWGLEAAGYRGRPEQSDWRETQNYFEAGLNCIGMKVTNAHILYISKIKISLKKILQ